MLTLLLSTLLLAATAPVDVSNAVGRPAKAWASSQLGGKDPNRYAVKNAFDGDLQTAWVEGVPGVGVGESLFVELEKPERFSGFLLVAGYARSAETLTQNSAPTSIELYADDVKVAAARIAWQLELPEGAPECRLGKGRLNFAPRMLLFSKVITAKKLELRITGAIKGTKFEDTGITEWKPILDGVAAELGETSYQDAAAALGSLREGKTPRLAKSPQAESPLAWHPHPTPGEAPAGWSALVAQRLAGAKLSPPQTWLKAFTPELLDQLVTLVGPDGEQLIGAMSWSDGDGEWSELWPGLVLDSSGSVAASGNITRLQNLFRNDGAPGCHGALPDAPAP